MKKIYKYLLNTLPRPLLIRLSYIFRLFAPLAYKGQNVHCPVCDRHFKSSYPMAQIQHIEKMYYALMI